MATTPVSSTRILPEKATHQRTAHPTPLPLFQDIEALAQKFEDEKASTPSLQGRLTPAKRAGEKNNDDSPMKKPKTSNSSTDLAQNVDTAPYAGHAPAVFTPPPAPRKNPPPARAPRQSPYEELFSKVEKAQCLTIQGLTVALNLFAGGSFMNAYSIKADTPLIPDVSNDQLLLKLYHGHTTKFTPKLAEYMQNSIANYKAVKELEIPVATIYNLDTALEDRFFIVKKIPHEVDLSQPHHLEQASVLFKKSFEKQVPIDLNFDNLRVEDNGSVTLIDFVEQPFDFSNEQKKRNFAIQFLKSWCKPVQQLCLAKNQSKQETIETARSLLTTLTQDLSQQGFDLNWNQAALDEFFFEPEKI